MPSPGSALSLLLALAASAQEPHTPQHAPAASTYDMQRWAAPGRCDPPSGDGREIDDADIATQTRRFLAVLDAAIDQGAEALRLEQLCQRIPVAFIPGLMPPARAEPWNPNPAQPVGLVAMALTHRAGQPYAQSITATYTPSGITVSLSTFDDGPTPYPPGARGYLVQDMGSACPLRLAALSHQLAGAGFNEQRDGMTPPALDFADFDSGVSVSFERPGQLVRVRLQGLFAEQRRHPDAACVAAIELAIAT